MADGLTEWLRLIWSRPGKRALAGPLLQSIDPHVASMLALRTVMHTVTRKMAIQGLARAIGRAIEDELRICAFHDQSPYGFKFVKDATKGHPMSYKQDYKRLVMLSASKRFGVVWQAWSDDARVRVGLVMIDLVIQHTRIIQQVREVGRTVAFQRILIAPTDELMGWLTSKHAYCELLHPPRLPMLVPPLPWKGVRGGGYLTQRMQYPLVTGFLRDKGHTPSPAEMPAVYGAINAIQAVPWKMNKPVLAAVMDLWENGGNVPKGADRHDTPIPPKPADYGTDIRAKRKWDWAAKEIFKRNRSEMGKRISVLNTLSLAKRFADDTIWFPHMLDSRGRMYPATRYLSPQGADLGRGLLLFANGKPLGPDGLRWLKIHAANKFGVDKVSDDDQVIWADAHLQDIRAVAQDPLGVRWWHDADKPVQFLAACLEIHHALSSEDPEKFITHLPCHQDGTCNGIQHLAAVSRDADAGLYVNLLPGPKPQDIYARVAEETVKCLTELSLPLSQSSGSCGAGSSGPSSSSSCAGGTAAPSVAGGTSAGPPGITDAEFAFQWLRYGIDRSTAKRPTMIVPYGGTRAAVEDYIFDWLHEKSKTKAHPWPGAERKACRFLAGVMWRIMAKVIPGPRAVMEWTRALARVLSRARHPLVWTTPSGFVVRQARMQVSSRLVKTKMGDNVLRVRIGEQTDRFDTRRQGQALAPNWIHSMDAACLHLTAVEMAQAGVEMTAVHDSYGALACDMTALASSLRRVFVNVYSTDRLEAFASDLSRPVGRQAIPNPPAMGTLDVQQVMGARYFFA